MSGGRDPLYDQLAASVGKAAEEPPRIDFPTHAELMAANAQFGPLDWGRIEFQRRIKELEALVFVPGLWRCAKCNFELVQANLNARDGTVTARNQPGDKCPNCDAPLWRVTERDAGNRLADRVGDIMEENIRLRQALGAHMQADAYRDDFPDNEQDAKSLRKSETWWRLTARGWLVGDDDDRCLQLAKQRAIDENPIRM